MDVHHIAAIAIALLTIAGMIARPWRIPEWLWAVAGAAAEFACGAVAAPAAWSAVVGGSDVYAFLMALALGRRVGGSALPYLFACAFVANAASFLLPSGNPANLLL